MDFRNSRIKSDNAKGEFQLYVYINDYERIEACQEFYASPKIKVDQVIKKAKVI